MRFWNGRIRNEELQRFAYKRGTGIEGREWQTRVSDQRGYQNRECGIDQINTENVRYI